MAKKKTRSRRRKTFSVINALEAYVYATILTEGTAGTSPFGMITGKPDISEGMIKNPFTGELASTGEFTGTDVISLADIATEPAVALSTLAMNFQKNLLPMSLAALTTSFTFRIGKRLLRRPISNINRNLVVPALGAGIRL
jgi:hypothetical protein